MTNREKLRATTLEDFLPDIKSYAEKFDECIMTLLPDGRLTCPWHNDCERCLEDWLNFEKGEGNNAVD